MYKKSVFLCFFCCFFYLETGRCVLSYTKILQLVYMLNVNICCTQIKSFPTTTLKDTKFVENFTRDVWTRRRVCQQKARERPCSQVGEQKKYTNLLIEHHHISNIVVQRYRLSFFQYIFHLLFLFFICIIAVCFFFCTNIYSLIFLIFN